VVSSHFLAKVVVGASVMATEALLGSASSDTSVESTLRQTKDASTTDAWEMPSQMNDSLRDEKSPGSL
jgi:hypothetical protein